MRAMHRRVVMRGDTVIVRCYAVLVFVMVVITVEVYMPSCIDRQQREGRQNDKKRSYPMHSDECICGRGTSSTIPRRNSPCREIADDAHRVAFFAAFEREMCRPPNASMSLRS
jgi:hypothetical protein